MATDRNTRRRLDTPCIGNQTSGDCFHYQALTVGERTAGDASGECHIDEHIDMTIRLIVEVC